MLLQFEVDPVIMSIQRQKKLTVATFVETVAMNPKTTWR